MERKATSTRGPVHFGGSNCKRGKSAEREKGRARRKSVGMQTRDWRELRLELVCFCLLFLVGLVEERMMSGDGVRLAGCGSALREKRESRSWFAVAEDAGGGRSDKRDK